MKNATIPMPWDEVDKAQLFQAWSVIPHPATGEDVVCGWHVESRRGSVAAFDEVIEFVPLLDTREARHIVWLVDKLLTASELDALREYLKRTHGWEVEAQAIELPVKEYEYPVAYTAKYGRTDFVPLSREEGYSLPMPIWGHIDTYWDDSEYDDAFEFEEYSPDAVGCVAPGCGDISHFDSRDEDVRVCECTEHGTLWAISSDYWPFNDNDDPDPEPEVESSRVS
jgi:hypothetical protein